MWVSGVHRYKVSRIQPPAPPVSVCLYLVQPQARVGPRDAANFCARKQEFQEAPCGHLCWENGTPFHAAQMPLQEGGHPYPKGTRRHALCKGCEEMAEEGEVGPVFWDSLRRQLVEGTHLPPRSLHQSLNQLGGPVKDGFCATDSLEWLDEGDNLGSQPCSVLPAPPPPGLVNMNVN